MTTPCDYEGVCRSDCQRRGDDCDGNEALMTDQELNGESRMRMLTRSEFIQIYKRTREILNEKNRSV